MHVNSIINKINNGYESGRKSLSELPQNKKNVLIVAGVVTSLAALVGFAYFTNQLVTFLDKGNNPTFPINPNDVLANHVANSQAAALMNNSLSSMTSSEPSLNFPISFNVTTETEAPAVCPIQSSPINTALISVNPTKASRETSLPQLPIAYFLNLSASKPNNDNSAISIPLTNTDLVPTNFDISSEAPVSLAIIPVNSTEIPSDTILPKMYTPTLSQPHSTKNMEGHLVDKFQRYTFNNFRKEFDLLIHEVNKSLVFLYRKIQADPSIIPTLKDKKLAISNCPNTIMDNNPRVIQEIILNNSLQKGFNPFMAIVEKLNSLVNQDNYFCLDITHGLSGKLSNIMGIRVTEFSN